MVLSESINSKLKCVNLNFGPQHPAAHGVLRLLLQLNGELIVNCDPNIGLLHRGSEKLMEKKIYINSLPYFDRMDYVSTLLQEHAYCINIETQAKKKNLHTAAIKTRTVFDELTRILNHYLAISCHALDVGSMSPIFWAFEDRERIMEFYEHISGARMHTAMYKPCYRRRTMYPELKKNILKYTSEGRITLSEMHSVLSNNKIWKRRLRNNGKISMELVEDYSLTGVMSRSSGLKRDIRLNKYTTYNNYYFLNFMSYITYNGDSFDRYMLRMYEINESLSLVTQNVSIKKKKTRKKQMIHRVYTKYNNMEAMIAHFKYWSTGFTLKPNMLYRPIESSKGEFGVTILSDGTNKPYRCKVRSPSFHHLNALNTLAKNVMIADLVTLIGTIDIVFGEIDR